MLKHTIQATVFLILFTFASASLAGKCEKEDFENFVSSNKGCIGIQPLQEIDKSKSKLVVFMHGDYSQKDSERAKLRREWYMEFSESINAHSSNFFHLARPGYRTENGNRSDGGDKKGTDRGDNYIWKRDIQPVGFAIQQLKDTYNPEQLIVIGHSGGAATTGILIGRFPDLIDEAILLACPCVVKEWRRHRVTQRGRIPNSKNTWPRSDSPHKHVNAISADTNVHIVIGEKDNNTLPKFSKKYLTLLNKKNKDVSAYLYVIKDADHASVLFNPETTSIIEKIVN